MQTLYDTLGVETTASAAEIKAAFRRKAQQHHPDKNGGTNTEEYQRIQHAYDVLGDAERKKKYDETGSDKPERDIDSESIKGIVSIIRQIMDHDNFDPETQNPITLCKKQVIEFKVQAAGERTKLERLIKKREKALKKLKVAEGKVNFIEQSLISAIKDLREQYDAIEVNMKLMDHMLNLLDDFDYEVSKMDQLATHISSSYFRFGA